MDFDYDTIPDEDNRNFKEDDFMDRLFPRYWYTDEIDTDVICPLETDLMEIIGFTGTQNWDDKDMFNVLFELNNRKLLHHPVYGLYGYGLPGVISHLLNLPYNYVNTLFCIANDYGLIEYGTNLQLGWTTEKSEKVIKRRKSNLKRINSLIGNINDNENF